MYTFGMKQVLILVPIFFLLALIALGAMLYRGTQSETPCTGEGCANLTADELADLVIEARTN